MSGRDLLMFAQALVRSPREVGAIAPSSALLAERLATVVPRRRDAVVVELGAGTGAVTTKIDQRRSPESTFLVFERNPRLAEQLTRLAPTAHVADDARDLRKQLASTGCTAADAIVCGLPWAIFSAQEHDELLSAITDVLAPGGVFTTFAYVHALVLPQARRFRDELTARFDEVLPTRAVLRNLPPAITYVCRSPRQAG